MEKNAQKRIKRTHKAPRIHIVDDIEVKGAIPKPKIPFVAAVLAPLSGHKPDRPLFQERKAIEVNRRTFNKKLSEIQPTLGFDVEFEKGKKTHIELKFSSIEDFEPQKVAKQVEQLKEMLDLRSEFSALHRRLTANGRLSTRLERLLDDPHERRTVLDDLQPKKPGPSGD